MIGYPIHFKAFIDQRLPTFEDTFTVQDMVEWIQEREPPRRPENIRDHLLKRTTNYPLRDNNNPPSTPADDLFFMISPERFRRDKPGVDPDPIHAGPHSARPLGKKERMEPPLASAPAEATGNLTERFRQAVAELAKLLAGRSLDDDLVKNSVREWLDGKGPALPWTDPEGLTADEWFFITTLYGTMNADGQRTHIRLFYPALFVKAAKRDIRKFVPGMTEYAGLRSPWMSKRLYRMGEILRERRITMSEYVDYLRYLQESASPFNPTPALDTIARDHRATAVKTLSVFIRDCVQCNCFPIDSRVTKQLVKYGLPEDERLLVGLSLGDGSKPEADRTNVL